jgi:hypothetical protein
MYVGQIRDLSDGQHRKIDVDTGIVRTVEIHTTRDQGAGAYEIHLSDFSRYRGHTAHLSST